jgi:hypothetical protein
VEKPANRAIFGFFEHLESITHTLTLAGLNPATQRRRVDAARESFRSQTLATGGQLCGWPW